MIYNRRRVGTALILGIAALLGACDSRNDSVGVSVVPDYTKFEVEEHELPLEYATISANVDGAAVSEGDITWNNIYVRSSYSYLGHIPNPEYGGIRTEYMTQLYVPAGFKFRETPLNHKIDSTFITLYYEQFTGDKQQPMQVEAYKLAKSLPHSKYSMGDVSEYLSDIKLGEQSYIAERGTDTIGGMRVVQIPLDELHPNIGQELYDKSRRNDPIFASQESFTKYFPGIYLTSSAGKGNVLKISKTALSFYYQYNDTVYKKDGTTIDTIKVSTHIQELSHTSEVPQISRYGNDSLDELLSKAARGEYTYVKSPAGVFTEITVPTTQIAKLLKEEPGFVKQLNATPLTIVGEANAQGTYSLTTPDYLLLLPKDSLQSFFEKEHTELNAPYTTYIGSSNISGATSYTFGNISTVITEHIKAHPDTDLKIVIVPIERTVATDNRRQNTGVSSSISNEVLPSAVKFKTNSKTNKHFKVYITKRRSGSPF